MRLGDFCWKLDKLIFCSTNYCWFAYLSDTIEINLLHQIYFLMRTNLFPAFIVLTCLWFMQSKSFAQSIATDSISVYWEHLDGAPGYVSHFAQCGDKLFAANPEGLFHSTDGGRNWRANQALGRCQILTLFANDSVLLVIEQRKFLVGTYQSEFVDELWVHRSENEGITWSHVGTIPMGFYQGGIDPEFQVSEVEALSPGQLSFLVSKRNKAPEHWYSQDNGQTWGHTTFTAANILTLNANNGKFSGAWKPTSGGLINGYLCLNPNFSDFQSIPFPSLNAPIVSAFSRAGTFRIFLRNNTVVSSFDAGSNWQTESLAVEDSVLTVTVKNTDFFLKTNKGIWRGQLSMPTNLSKIYNGEEARSPTAKTFASLPSGYWINTISNQSIFKAPGSFDWEVRSQGLATDALSLQGVCGRLYCSTGIKRIQGIDSPDGFFVSNREDGAWQAIVDQSQLAKFAYLGFNYLGKANGFDFSYIPPFIARSADCGSTWDTLTNLVVGAAVKGMVTSGTRLFFYSPFDFNAFFTDDNGVSWNTLPIPNFATVQNIFANGDTILAFESGGSKLHRTINLGQSWETIQLNSLPGAFKNAYWQKAPK